MMMPGGEVRNQQHPMSMSMVKPPKLNIGEESKEDKPKYMNIAMDPDAMQSYLDIQREQNEYNKCVCCSRSFTAREEQQNMKLMLTSTECFHLLHKHCLSETAVHQIKKTKTIVCPKPDCKKQVQDWELREYMGNDYEEVEKIVQAQFMADNPNLVTCSCGNVMEVVEGKVDLNQKDDTGKQITREAAECMAKFRVKCPLANCGKIFCTNPQCQAEPYHTGKTCSQYKEYKEMKKCRFCDSKLTLASPSMVPAFKEVCRSEDCIERMNNNCDKILPCGHFCCGFKGE